MQGHVIIKAQGEPDFSVFKDRLTSSIARASPKNFSNISQIFHFISEPSHSKSFLVPSSLIKIYKHFYVGDIFEIFDYFKDNFKRIGHFQRQNFLQNIIIL